MKRDPFDGGGSATLASSPVWTYTLGLGEVMNEEVASDLRDRVAVIGVDMGQQPYDRLKKIGKKGWKCASSTFDDEELECAAAVTYAYLCKLQLQDIPCVLLIKGGPKKNKAGIKAKLQGFLAKEKSAHG